MNSALKLVFDSRWLAQLIAALQAERLIIDEQEFRNQVFSPDWPHMALKQRVSHIAHCLHDVLPDDYLDTLPVLEAVADKFTGLAHWVFPEYIAQQGLAYPQVSLAALARLTQGSTSEYAVRFFIEQNPTLVLTEMLQWTQHPNEHVRRLASEGCRPRLPWSKVLSALKQEPPLLRPILEALKRDPSAYVRKSVANQLNDIAKDHPRWVLALCREWYGQHKATDWIVKHGLRTLLKQAHPEALVLMGYEPPKAMAIASWFVAPQVILGNQLCFSARLNLAQMHAQKVRLEYAIVFVRKQKTPYRKLFKISEFTVNKPIKSIKKQHSFKAISTRKYCQGRHRIELIVNGVVCAQSTFEVIGEVCE